MGNDTRAELISAVEEALNRRQVADDLSVRQAVQDGIAAALRDLGIGDRKGDLGVSDAREAIRWAVTRQTTERSIGVRVLITMLGGFLLFLGAALWAGIEAMIQR